jgi:hypothetical protein
MMRRRLKTFVVSAVLWASWLGSVLAQTAMPMMPTNGPPTPQAPMMPNGPGPMVPSQLPPPPPPPPPE